MDEAKASRWRRWGLAATVIVGALGVAFQTWPESKPIPGWIAALALWVAILVFLVLLSYELHKPLWTLRGQFRSKRLRFRMPVVLENKPKPASSKYSEAESKAIVENLRAAWSRFGQYSVRNALTLFIQAESELDESGVYWRELLFDKRRRLENAVAAMDSTMAFDSTKSGEDVLEAFHELYDAYFNVLKWLTRCDHHGDISLTSDKLQRRHTAWMITHREFADKLRDINETSEVQRRLKIEPSPHLLFDDRPFYQMLKEAEAPEYLQAREPSGPRLEDDAPSEA